MQVDIDEIEKITLRLLSKLRIEKGTFIEIKNDFYWDISTEEIYNPYEKPVNITLGQLSDDLSELHKIIKDDDMIAYDLKRVAVIFQALSAENQTTF
jgi:hypothetical protein